MLAPSPSPSARRPSSPPEGRCPSCHSAQLVSVMELREIPVHTSALLPSRAEALAYPRADLRLDVCRDCGLLTNSAFDAPDHDYSASYDEVQSFSPRFRAYASELARTLVERHSLKGRDVFEIGSGRAHLLLEICALTGGAGYAVDPSFREDRLEGSAADRVTVERDFFAAEHVPSGVALILCRHTLEHVHDVAGFLHALRSGLERAPDAVVVFEVPDTYRVLQETAFWDLYYEHCSYFTPGSLARAFRVAGLPPTRLELTFDDQYVVVTAEPGQASDTDPLPIEEGPAEVVDLAAGFAQRVQEAREHWGSLLRAAHECGEKAVIWGAGSKGVGFLSMLGVADEVTCAVDVNPTKHGLFLPGTGHEVVAPEQLRDLRPDIVVVMNPSYASEIGDQLGQLGIDAKVLTL
jgi:C-methyltransferase C-terminal domain/Methyltransferase domain